MAVTVLSPAGAVDAILAAVRTGAPELTVLDELLGERATPQALVHRTVRVDPGQLLETGKSRPGDVLQVRERFGLVLQHEGAAGLDLATYRQATADLLQLAKALLTRTELDGRYSPTFGGVARARLGHRLVQTLTIELAYTIDLPAWAPDPEV